MFLTGDEYAKIKKAFSSTSRYRDCLLNVDSVIILMVCSVKYIFFKNARAPYTDAICWINISLFELCNLKYL